MSRKWVYFDATGEALIEVLKGKTDLPRDVKLIKVFERPEMQDSFARKPFNILRFIVESEKFQEIPEGGILPRIDVKSYYNSIKK